MFVTGAGFALLRLTGQIDGEGKAATLRALDLLARATGEPAYRVQQADLASWANP